MMPKLLDDRTIEWPTLDDETIARVIVDFTQEIDYLYLFLVENPVAAVWDLREDNRTYVGLRMIDDETWTNEAVGIMIEDFYGSMVHAHPSWARVVTDTGATKRAAIRSLIEDVAAMAPGGVPFQ